MKKGLCVVAALVLCGGLPILAAPGLTASAPPARSASSAPGVEAAQALSTLTGVAISPLLGVGAVGATKYFRTPSERRQQLPWFAQPWFWAPALLLVTLVFVKDALGPVVPTALKKPFDVAELFENKFSALVATGAFVPIVASIFHSANTAAWLDGAGLAAISLAPLYNLLIVPIAMAAFVVVFLASHAVNVLILLSPFATVDAALKAFRLFLLSTVMVTSLANPYVGAAWALVIIFISYFIAGWSLRLSVTGSVFAWDYLTFRRKRFRPQPGALWMFTAQKMGRTPVRTYGKLERDAQGRLVMDYRPWLVLPRRRLVLPEGRYFVGRGIFYPEIHQLAGEESQARLMLPPRYRGHDQELTRLLGFAPAQDIGLLRGLKGLWRWFKNLFSPRHKPSPDPTLAPA